MLQGHRHVAGLHMGVGVNLLDVVDGAAGDARLSPEFLPSELVFWVRKVSSIMGVRASMLTIRSGLEAKRSSSSRSSRPIARHMRSQLFWLAAPILM